MKNKIAFIFALIAWFAVITQYFLMLANRVTSITETTIRFFSFFTILTNLLAAVYFTLVVLQSKKGVATLSNKPGTLTALAVYITIVGLVYQALLRAIWKPEGIQMFVNELLHSVLPLLVVLFWWRYENKKAVAYQHILWWLVYPLVYLAYILIRGHWATFYPYPFVDVTHLGLQQVLINSAALLLFFMATAALFIAVGKMSHLNTP